MPNQSPIDILFEYINLNSELKLAMNNLLEKVNNKILEKQNEKLEKENQKLKQQFKKFTDFLCRCDGD